MRLLPGDIVEDLYFDEPGVVVRVGPAGAVVEYAGRDIAFRPFAELQLAARASRSPGGALHVVDADCVKPPVTTLATSEARASAPGSLRGGTGRCRARNL